MTKIRSTDENGNNNYKNRNVKLNDLWLRIFYALLVGAMVVGIYRTRIEAMGEELKTQAYEIKSFGEKITNTEKDVVYLKTEIPNIKTSMADIKGDISEIKQDIKKLLSRTQ